MKDNFKAFMNYKTHHASMVQVRWIRATNFDTNLLLFNH